jgi:hypothetical protein
MPQVFLAGVGGTLANSLLGAREQGAGLTPALLFFRRVHRSAAAGRLLAGSVTNRTRAVSRVLRIIPVCGLSYKVYVLDLLIEALLRW